MLARTEVAQHEAGPSRREVCAWHEAGHVVLTLALGYRVLGVSIEHGVVAGGDGVTLLGVSRRRGSDLLASRYDVVKSMGGAVAELIRFDAADPRNSVTDRAQARACATVALADFPYMDADDFLIDCGLEAERILRALWPSVETLAVALLDRSQLNEAELRALVRFDDDAVARALEDPPLTVHYSPGFRSTALL